MMALTHHPPRANAMLDWLKKLTPRRTPAPADAPPDLKAVFRLALAHYPAHVPPHRGLGGHITPEQAQHNLDWFRRSVPERLHALRALATDTGLALPADLQRPVASLDEAKELVARLIAWTRACWPDRPYRPEHLSDSHWAMSARTGDDAIFSVVLDVATLLGQVAMTGRSEWRWGLDMARASRGPQPMFSARRVVLFTPPLGEQRAPCMMDMEALVLERYRRPKDFRFNQTLEYDPWMEYVRDGYTGRVIDLMAGR